MAPTVRAAIDEWETTQMARLVENDAKALETFGSETKVKKMYVRRNDRTRRIANPAPKTREIVTEFSVNTAQEIFGKWVEMEEFLLVKFLDGNVKGQNPDGSWVTNGYSEKIPGKIEWPGYTEAWKRTVAKEHGSIVEAK